MKDPKLNIEISESKTQNLFQDNVNKDKKLSISTTGIGTLQMKYICSGTSILLGWLCNH